MKRSLLIFFGIIIIMVIGVIFYYQPQTVVSGKVTVVASIYPIAEFAKGVGGDLVSVSYVTPQGIEPHDYEPTPRDVQTASSANLFLYNGGEIDPWADKIGNAWNNADGSVLNLLKVVNPNATVNTDPHVWLDLILVKTEVQAIRDELITLDPAHKDSYLKNSEAYLQKLQNLHDQAASDLANCASRTIVVSHEAFNYLAQRYNLNVISITGLSPDAEPSAKQLAEISSLVKKNKIKYIFFEPFASTKLADTVARETGAAAKMLNPIEGITAAEARMGEDYISLMKKNFEILKETLICQ